MLLLITYDVNTGRSQDAVSHTLNRAFSTPKHRLGKVDLEKLQNNVLITVSEFRIRFSNVLLMQLRHTN